MNYSIERQTKEYSKRHRQKKWWQRAVSVLACMTVFCTTYALVLPAITMTEEVYCGYEEHTEHTEECYERVQICESSSDDVDQQDMQLVCGLNEYEHIHSEICYAESQELICSDTEHTHEESCYAVQREMICAETGHVHSPACYAESEPVGENNSEHVHSDACYEMKLTCKKELHTHTLQCYSNPDADIEDSSVWERSFNNILLSGDWNEDVADIAETQLGYTESEQNYLVAADGTTRNGYTRYAAWYSDGLSPYADWNSIFASFCIRYAGIPDNCFPIHSDAGAWCAVLKQRGLFADKSNYVPAAGDLVLLDLAGKGSVDKVGILIHTNEDSVQVILGDYGNAVVQTSFSLDSVFGYGSISIAYRAYVGDVFDEKNPSENAGISEEQEPTEDTTDSDAQETAEEEVSEELEELPYVAAVNSVSAAEAPDYIGLINTANQWQIVAEQYSGNANTNKVPYDTDGDGVADVLIQKNVVPTGNENEFLVYLSITKQMTWDTLLAQSQLGLTTQGKWKEPDVGSLVNTGSIGGNKSNILQPGMGQRNYQATIYLTRGGKTVHTFTGWYNGTTPNASNCTGYIILKGLENKAIIASIQVNLHNDGSGSGGTLSYTIDLDQMSKNGISYAAEEISLDSVIDQLGDGMIYDGVVACDGSVSEANRTLTWTIHENPNVEGINYQNPVTGYLENVAQLVYRVKLDVTQDGFHSCADNMNSVTADPESYAVNQYATLNYRVGTQGYQRDFPIPYVRGLHYNVVFSKKGDDGKYLSGAVFGLYEADGVTPVYWNGEPYTVTTEKTTPANKFRDLPCGSYVVRELQAAPGYSAPDPAEWAVTLNYTTSSVQLVQDSAPDSGDEKNMRWTGYDVGGVWTIINNKNPFTYDILLVKQNRNGERLPNAAFSLTPDTDGIWQHCTTNEAGQFLFEGNFGLNLIFELTELAPPDGYYGLSDSIQLTVQENPDTGEYVPVLINEDTVGELVSLELVESEMPGKYILKVTVINETGYVLPETGGIGTLPFALCGLAMIVSGVTIAFSSLRRIRERGEH